MGSKVLHTFQLYHKSEWKIQCERKSHIKFVTLLQDEGIDDLKILIGQFGISFPICDRYI